MEIRSQFETPGQPEEGGSRPKPAARTEAGATRPAVLRIDVRSAVTGETCTVDLQLGSEDEKDWVALQSAEIDPTIRQVRWPVPPVPARRLRLQLEPHGDTEIRPWLES